MPYPAHREASAADALLAVLVACAAAAAGSAWIAVSSRPLASDGLTYYTLAKHMVDGSGYVLRGIPTAYWNPGYPLALAGVFAVFGSTTTSVAVFNVVLHVISAVLTFILALRLGIPRWIALAAGLAVALYPDKLYFVSQGLAENLAVPLVLAIALCWIAFLDGRSLSYARIALVGALLGLLILTRTSALALLPLFMLLTWVMTRRRGGDGRRAVAFVAVLVLGCVLVLSPWVVRNKAVLGAPVMTTIAGANLLIALDSEPPGSFQDTVLDPVVPVTKAGDEVRADREYMARALRELRSNPWKWFRIPAANVRGLFTTPSSSSEMGVRLNLASAILTPVRVMLALVAIVILVVRLPRRSDAAKSIAAVCIVWALAHAVLAPFGSVRYMATISPLLVVLAAYLASVFSSRRSAAGSAPGDPARPPEGSTA